MTAVPTEAGRCALKSQAHGLSHLLTRLSMGEGTPVGRQAHCLEWEYCF